MKWWPELQISPNTVKHTLKKKCNFFIWNCDHTFLLSVSETTVKIPLIPNILGGFELDGGPLKLLEKTVDLKAVSWFHLHLWTSIHGQCWLQGGRREPQFFRTLCISFFWLIIDNSGFLLIHDNSVFLVDIDNSAYLAVEISQPLPCHSPQHCCPSESKYFKKMSLHKYRPLESKY